MIFEHTYNSNSCSSMLHTAEIVRSHAGVFAIVISVTALSLGDALIKGAGLTLPLWQMFILRSVLTVVPLWWLSRRHGPIVFQSPRWVVIRSTCLVLMWLSYYVALPLMPLSLAAAAYYTGPLFIVGLSAAVGRRWPTPLATAAIGLGFVGVLLVIRPDTSGFDLATVLPLIAAVLYAGAMVITARKCRDDNPIALGLALNIAFIVGGTGLAVFSGQDGSAIFGPWQRLDLALLATVVALAVCILVGSIFAAIAYQKGPPATVAAFDYSYLIFSLLWGALFFGEYPGLISLIGIAVIVGAGFLALKSRNGHRGEG